MNYRPPLQDMHFVLGELVSLNSVCGMPAYNECGADLIDAILGESARFACEVMQPLNRDGNQPPWLDAEGVHFPEAVHAAWRQYIETGWQGVQSPVAYGGQGLPALVGFAVEEMWGSANLALSLLPMLTQGAIWAIEQHAGDELKATWLPRLISGEWTGTMNLTESQAGSDLAQLSTVAKAQADGNYRIHGQKIFITWGDHDLTDNIVHLVLARLPDSPAGVKGISLFLVPKFLLNADDTPGERNDVRCLSLEHKLGLHGAPTAVMSFGDGEGAVGYLIGEPNQGLACMFTMMNHSRLGVGIEGLAVSEAAYQAAVAYARTRI